MSASDEDLRLGVDLGGTKIEAAMLHSDGSYAFRQRRPNPGGYDPIIAVVNELCIEAERATGIAENTLPLGIGTPGSPSPETGLMRNCNSTALNGRPLCRDLESATGRQVRIANDADCFALSEARDGAGNEVATIFGVIIGTGVGGGIVVDGQLLSGPNRVAGEWGHNRLPLEQIHNLPAALKPGQRICYCGNVDCVETWLSGPGLAQTHLDLHGVDIDEEELRSGEHGAALQASLACHGSILGAALAGVVNVLDPQVIVLGGGLSNLSVLYEHVPLALAQHAFSDCCFTPVLQAHHGDSGGVRGAAWLW